MQVCACLHLSYTPVVHWQEAMKDRGAKSESTAGPAWLPVKGMCVECGVCRGSLEPFHGLTWEFFLSGVWECQRRSDCPLPP